MAATGLGTALGHRSQARILPLQRCQPPDRPQCDRVGRLLAAVGMDVAWKRAQLVTTPMASSPLLSRDEV